MVSAKTNGASEQREIVRNKDGSIRKPLGRKTKIDNARGSLSEGNVSRDSNTEMSHNVILRKDNGNVITVHRDDEEEVMDNESEGMRMEINCMRDQIKFLQSRLQENSTSPLKFYQNSKISPPLDSRIFQSNVDHLMTPPSHDASQFRTEPQASGMGGYKMRLEKINGNASDDYDLWWADLQAFFKLYQCNEQSKVNLFNAHLGGEARRFIQKENLANIDKVENLHALLQATFSKKQDWESVLMNIKQKVDENILDFSVRVRVAARNCEYISDNMDKMSIICLKRGCTPQLSALFDHCLMSTPYDELVQLATQYERKQEINLKKTQKRKCDDVDILAEDEAKSSKRGKQNFADNLKQINESINSLNDKIRSNNSSSYRNTKPSTRPSDSNKANMCYHCAKPNHRFNDCRSASQEEKSTISRALKDRKFDFTKLREKAKAYETRMNQFRSNTTSLNSSAPTQTGN
jgi:hypothetical protein